MSDFILYQTEDDKSRIALRVDGDTVWLTQLQVAELFQATKQNISLHLKNILEDGELNPDATVKESLTVRAGGKREVQPKNRTETRMSFWRDNVDQIIVSNGFPLLDHAGKISHRQMEQTTADLYLNFDQRRKAKEARDADLEDEADLKALEENLKNRPGS